MEKLRIVGCVAFSALSACSLLFASDLNDADHVGTVVEAGGSASGNDATGGGPGPDAAGPDGGQVAFSVGCGSYTPEPKFCDDFDDAATPRSKWDDVEQNDASAQVSLEPTTTWSAPHALRTVLADAGGCTYSRVGKVFTGVGTQRQEVRLQMRPLEPWLKDFAVLAINLDANAASHCQILIDEYGDKSSGKPTGSHVVAQVLPNIDDDRPLVGFTSSNEWTELYVVATAVDGDGGVQLTTGFAGGSNSGETPYTFTQCKLGNAIRVDVGFHCDSATATALYDDVRVDWQ